MTTRFRRPPPTPAPGADLQAFSRERAYEEGLAAFRSGADQGDNPYRQRTRTATSDLQAHCWDLGWRTAERVGH